MNFIEPKAKESLTILKDLKNEMADFGFLV